MGWYPKLDRADEVERAVEAARAYAQEHGAPLTMERLACSLGIDKETLRALTEEREGPLPVKTTARTRLLLRRALDEACASVLEHGMRKGGSPVMAMFLCKNDHGFSERETALPVIITGEEAIEP